MKTEVVHQSRSKTVVILYNDNGEAVARLDDPRMVTGEEANTLAQQFADKNPELFPGHAEKQKKFDAMFAEQKTPVKKSWWKKG